MHTILGILFNMIKVITVNDLNVLKPVCYLYQKTLNSKRAF